MPHILTTWLIFALLMLFVVAQVYVEAANEGPTCHWWSEPMSHYLGNVKHSLLQIIAYFGFAIAELLLIAHDPRGAAATACLAISAAGLIGVTLSGMSNPGWKYHAWVERLHVICAGLAFGGALVAEAIYLWHMPAVWLVFGAAATAIAFARFAPNAHALEEKIFAAWLLAAFVAIVGVPL